MGNLDANVVAGFGDEWTRFDQSSLSPDELRAMFDDYFAIFPWRELPAEPVGFDLGCGSGRWARLVAPKVGTLHLIDPSEAIEVAKRNLEAQQNCVFHRADVENIPLPPSSCDFGYSLGVLHHIPDTEAGLKRCTEILKPGAPFLLYLYYAFDNRPWWFRGIWRISDAFRTLVSRLPHFARYGVSQMVAATVYFPLARLARSMEAAGMDIERFPLSQYRHRSFYTMRTDALDRLGTRLERRFSKNEIREMMERAGLADISFDDTPPYWTAVGRKVK